jgi:hypothetical protein
MKLKGLTFAFSLLFVATPGMAVQAGNCMTMSDLARSVAKARDGGISFDKARSVANDTPNAKAKTITRLLVKKVYRNPALTPDEFAVVIFKGCVKSVKSAKSDNYAP